MPASVTGAAGEIRWHYYMAAKVASFAVSRERGSWSMSGTIVEKDAFKLAQSPLVFIARHNKGAWHWPIQQITVHESGRFTASLGPPVN